MAYSVRQERRGLATELRHNLDTAERMVLQLRRDNVRAFLELLDRTEDCFAQLESDGLDLRPEQSRWHSLLWKLKSDAKRVVRVMDTVGGLSHLRESNPDGVGLWWKLDEVVEEERRKLWKRIGMTVGVMVSALVLIWVLLEYIIPVDENTVVASEAISTIQQLVFEGRWDEALAVVERAKERLTQPDAELLIWEAVMWGRLGEDDVANSILEQAAALIDPEREASFWWTLGSVYSMASDLKKSRQIADAMIRKWPDDPQGYFLLGNVEELEGNRNEAIELFDKTFDLAMETNTQLAVIARVRMGTLLQQPVNMGGPSGDDGQ